MGRIVMAISADVTALVLALTARAIYVSRSLTTTLAVAGPLHLRCTRTANRDALPEKIAPEGQPAG
ncbi:MAG TPA: hypothetical protein VMJ64_13535 [Anaerolineales bacterium]|nr:hypothetical protein [Anaerolineales bacterium]